MHLDCHAHRVMPCTAAQAFALAVDTERFPRFFTGCGPIPAVRAVEPDGPPRVGATRRVRNADGSVLTETVTAFAAPHRHAYRLAGLRPPFAWLVREAAADWRIDAAADGARVAWSYRFELTHPLAAPLARPLLGFMARAMQRCLDAMARELAAPVQGRP
ncbi:SRPBCC family protein [Lysobacter sp. N42]|uniref:SRPBCC family protein n=1 Tax=Lysobacter sp. N42 TaxID=2545719 RepID=UPI00104301A3|nr:SRPBCC family protein [Lysobacter sp. N42]TCZ83632.1 SRPBCC family protein [Lysobacter sp. N42]